MNWGLFALCVSALLVAAWIWLVAKRNWAWPGLVASVGCLLVACFNSAAPFRGAIDPDYVGFGFGLLHADKGLAVTLLSGPLLLIGAASAFVAVSRREGPALWLVAAFSAAMLVISGIPTIATLLTNPDENKIQFGEYLTIPGVIATLIGVALFVIPFAVGLVWAPRAAMRGR